MGGGDEDFGPWGRLPRLPPWVPGYFPPNLHVPTAEERAEEERRQLIAQTEAELNLVPNYAPLLSDWQGERFQINARIIKEWKERREELWENLKSLKENPKAFDSLGLGQWKEALHEMGEQRKLLSHNVGVVTRELLAEKRDDLGKAAGHLGELRGKMERIEAGLREIAWVTHLAEDLDHILMAVETFEAIAHAEAHAAKGGPVLGPMALDGARIVATSRALTEFVEVCGEWAKEMDLKIEGYDSMADLEKDIQLQLVAVQAEMDRVHSLEYSLREAEQQYAAPVAGQKRP